LLIGGGGLLLSGLSALFVVGVIHAWRSHEAWESIAGGGVIALATAVIGLQICYIGLTGRLRGPINRWLRAIGESVLNVKVP